jgi:hypothetical protein
MQMEARLERCKLGVWSTILGDMREHDHVYEAAGNCLSFGSYSKALHLV